MSEMYQRQRVDEHYNRQNARVIHYGILTDNVLIEDKSGARQVVKVPEHLASSYNRQLR